MRSLTGSGSPAVSRQSLCSRHPRAGRRNAVLAFAVVIAIGTAVLRIWYPVDVWVGMLEIIQTERADLAQYIPFVIVGVLAYRRGLLQTLPVRVGYACLRLRPH